MEDWLLLGLTAGLLTTVGFVPQLIRGYRTKKMSDVSISMPILLSVGMFLWLLYGIAINSIPVIFWNALSLGLNIMIIALILRYRPRDGTMD